MYPQDNNKNVKNLGLTTVQQAKSFNVSVQNLPNNTQPIRTLNSYLYQQQQQLPGHLQYSNLVQSRQSFPLQLNQYQPQQIISISPTTQTQVQTLLGQQQQSKSTYQLNQGQTATTSNNQGQTQVSQLVSQSNLVGTAFPLQSGAVLQNSQFLYIQPQLGQNQTQVQNQVGQNLVVSPAVNQIQQLLNQQKNRSLTLQQQQQNLQNFQNVNWTTQQILRQICQESPFDPMCILIERLQKSFEAQDVSACHGIKIKTNSEVKIVVGPILGTVSDTKANIVVEIEGPQERYNLLCYVIQEDGQQYGQPQIKEFKSREPENFEIEGLQPNSLYKLVIGGVNVFEAREKYAEFRTLPRDEDIKNFKILALSCNRMARLLLGQENPWKHLDQYVKSTRIDLMLHLGDQVYAVGDQIDDLKEVFDSFEKKTQKQKEIAIKRGKDLFRQTYRDTWSKPYVSSVLSRVQNQMIWSDNDVANDFTTLKDKNGNQGYHPEFLKCGVEVYREYQRQLWDPDCKHYNEKTVEEWHKHTYGKVGVFLIDMRGNRISVNGVQEDHKDIVCEDQWRDLEAFVRNDKHKVLLVCSEIPFIGDSPETCQKNAAKIDFLRDHWPYQLHELTRLLDLLFEFKAKGEGREVLLIGGDIHTGVTSVIYDNARKQEIRHFTTSPITNHVCKFFPQLEGKLNDRYSYKHVPLGEHKRNYLDIDIRLEPTIKVDAKLIVIDEESDESLHH